MYIQRQKVRYQRIIVDPVSVPIVRFVRTLGAEKMLKLVIHLVSVAPRIFLEDRRLILYRVGHLAVVAVVAIVIRVVLALAHPLGAALARVGHPEYGVLAAGGHGDGVGADGPARKDAVVAGTLLLAALGERVTVSYHVTLVAARLPPAGCDVLLQFKKCIRLK